jgi:hypothetical protein
MAAAAAGCDVPPAPPKTAAGGTLDVLMVNPQDPMEVELATQLEAARVNYRYRLEVLEAYYTDVGYADNMLAARRERANLNQAQAFDWHGLPEVLPPQGESFRDTDERLLVEYVVSARQEFIQAAQQLRQFYAGRGDVYRAKVMANLMDRFDPVRMYVYYPDAEIPGPDLRPTAVIPEADELFAKAHKLFRDGKGFLRTFITTNYDKERQALGLFRKLVREHPTSTKIALSAYYIADIYKEYFNEDVLAVRWYERAWQWDSNITEPARFQAATVHDIRLHNPRKAIDLYRAAIEYEQFNRSNTRFAERRIRALEKQLAREEAQEAPTQ